MTDEQVKAVVAKKLREGVTVRKIVRKEGRSGIRVFLNGIDGKAPRTAWVHELNSGAYAFCFGNFTMHGWISDL